ncbi:MAG: transcription termination factor Rho [Kiritimatiellae bacterium]|nr:transcription termination factor Rho [Kiritimatiellia bacterium]
MSEELDVFAMSAKPVKQSQPPKPVPAPQSNQGGKKQFHKNHHPQFQRREKQNNSPIRGANGSESVNPLLNAPLPQEQRVQAQETASNPNRNPDLPEYRLADIQIWPAQQIVDCMMPGADPEELGTYRKHELIFAAIRSYLAKGGAVLASGCLEIMREGHGFLRSAKNNFLACPEDVFVTQQQIRRHALRTGDIIEGPIRDPRDRDRFFCLGNVNTVNGKEPSVAARVVHFENLTATFPTRRIILETDPKEYSTRVIDLFTPIGFGQRGLIIAPPRVGKTVLLQKMANAISTNHPDAMLIILLIDERPEEVTDMQRNTKAMVLSSTFDEEPQHHVNVTEMVLEMSKRQVENGRDVIILMDSITRMARAYNTVQPHSGKILTGGVDALAMHRPKRFFGAARNIEGAGSLTIIATGLVDTGSRMDEVIFEEFKGTGNMEIVLDRSLADKRIFPAIDIEKSGTRKEDLLLDPVELEKTWGMRRILSPAGSESAMKSVLNSLKKTQSNPEFLLALDLKNLG